MATVQTSTVKRILTRSSGYLVTVCSHSLQPYRGCGFGNALCGAYCYAQHNVWLAQGRPWGSLVEVRVNAADAYRAEHEAERRWARRARGEFAIFLSSSTDPFLPQEATHGATARVLDALLEAPPDALILQTHTHRARSALDRVRALAQRCRVRLHLTIESDLDRLPGLPPPASSVADRLDCAAEFRRAGVFTVVTASPLLPIADPDAFFARVAACADAVVLDHFIEGDGTADGSRTRRTGLPAAIAAIDPEALELAYRDRMVAIARRHLPGRVGVSIDGFAGRYLP